MSRQGLLVFVLFAMLLGVRCEKEEDEEQVQIETVFKGDDELTTITRTSDDHHGHKMQLVERTVRHKDGAHDQDHAVHPNAEMKDEADKANQDDEHAQTQSKKGEPKADNDPKPEDVAAEGSTQNRAPPATAPDAAAPAAASSAEYPAAQSSVLNPPADDAKPTTTPATSSLVDSPTSPSRVSRVVIGSLAIGLTLLIAAILLCKFLRFLVAPQPKPLRTVNVRRRWNDQIELGFVDPLFP